jgi:putative sterol carrier protein
MTARDFILNLPKRVNTAALTDLDSTFHFDISGPNGGHFTVVVGSGEVNVETGLIGDPKCVVTVSDTNLEALLTGKLNPMMAMMMGKIKVSNTSEMMKYAKIFGLL